MTTDITITQNPLLDVPTTTPTDFTLLYNPNWGYLHCNTKAYFQSTNPTDFQQGYYGIENTVLKGSFHLRYSTNSPLCANKIEMILEGKQCVSWKDVHGKEIRGEKMLCKQTKIIWESLNNEFEDILTMDLPFEFSLPNNLPATITPLNVSGHITGGVAGDGSEVGHITYSLRAEISRPMNIFKLRMNTKKIIDVWCRIHRWKSPPLHDRPFKWKGNVMGIGYEVELEKTLFNYKDIINIPMKFVVNDITNVKIKKIYVRIKEYHKLKVNGKSKTIGGFVVADSAFGEQMRKSTTTTSGRDHDYFIRMQLNLTKTNLGRKLNCSTKTEYIDIRHKLKVKITLNPSSKSIELDKEISILNVFAKRDHPCFAQQCRLMNTWFYHLQEENLSKATMGDESSNFGKVRQRFSWFGGMKNGNERFSLFSGNRWSHAF
ncbi:15660_t:CDS:1 [Funneliformis caledonium]|uniref:15660_t:CDS:1 n=1 Tax=Funneliformis caledonium TaxID=1117310 RepID=A0A9N8WRY3_9GLOM|nr:15660_t:CDS:1 [Funneliformis caledonium]